MSGKSLKPCPLPRCNGAPVEVHDDEEHSVYCSNTACHFRFGWSLPYEDWQSFPRHSREEDFWEVVRDLRDLATSRSVRDNGYVAGTSVLALLDQLDA